MIAVFSFLELSNKYFRLFFYFHRISVVYDTEMKHREARLLTIVFQKQPKESSPLRARLHWYTKHLDRLPGTDAFWHETALIFASKLS